MSIRTNLETLGRRHHALEREINGEQLHPSCEDLKGAELRRPKSLVKDEIACLGHDAGERASGVKLSAAEKRKKRRFEWRSANRVAGMRALHDRSRLSRKNLSKGVSACNPITNATSQQCAITLPRTQTLPVVLRRRYWDDYRYLVAVEKLSQYSPGVQFGTVGRLPLHSRLTHGELTNAGST
jgi:hypothetical protein